MINLSINLNSQCDAVEIYAEQGFNVGENVRESTGCMANVLGNYPGEMFRGGKCWEMSGVNVRIYRPGMS